MSEGLNRLKDFSKPVGVTRVLQLIPRLQLGGAERFALSLVEQLNRDGLEIMVCATEPGEHPWLEEFLRLTPNVILLHRCCHPHEYPTFLGSLIQAWQIDVVLISHSVLAYQLLPYLRFHCPAVSFLDYNHIVDRAWNNGGFARMGLEAQRYLDLNVVNSLALRDWMVAQGANPAQIEVCYINVNQHTWHAVRHDRQAERARLGLNQTAVVLLYSARLDVQKRPNKLVELLRAPELRSRNVHCLVAGDGPEAQRLRLNVQRSGLEKSVTLLGAVAPNDMPPIMAASDILFLPSQDEGIALVVFEAMAMGLPIVAAKVGGQAELVTPDTGYLVPLDQQENKVYIAALSALIDSQMLRSEMGCLARERIETAFTIEHMAARMRQLVNLARERTLHTPRPVAGEAKQAASRATQTIMAHQQVQLGWTSLELEHWKAYNLVYWFKWRILRPIYYWGLAHRLCWLVPIGTQVARWINRLLKHLN